MRPLRSYPRSFRYAPLTSTWMRRASTSTMAFRDCLNAVEKSADQPSRRAIATPRGRVRRVPEDPAEHPPPRGSPRSHAFGRGYAAVLDGIDERAVVPFVLVRIGLGEVGERAVERLATSEVGGYRDAIAGPGVGAGQGGGAELGVRDEQVGAHRVDVRGQLPVPELAHVEVA